MAQEQLHFEKETLKQTYKKFNNTELIEVKIFPFPISQCYHYKKKNKKTRKLENEYMNIQEKIICF